jgi:hypothetical protein
LVHLGLRVIELELELELVVLQNRNRWSWTNRIGRADRDWEGIVSTVSSAPLYCPKGPVLASSRCAIVQALRNVGFVCSPSVDQHQYQSSPTPFSPVTSRIVLLLLAAYPLNLPLFRSAGPVVHTADRRHRHRHRHPSIRPAGPYPFPAHHHHSFIVLSPPLSTNSYSLHPSPLIPPLKSNFKSTLTLGQHITNGNDSPRLSFSSLSRRHVL